MLKSYETVLVFTPVYTEGEVKEAIGKYLELMKSNDAEIVHEDFWGLRQLAYPIKKKTTGFYTVVEYSAPAVSIEPLEVQFKRDENILRFLTTRLDKHAVIYNEKKRKGLAGRNRKKTSEESSSQES